jgi:hypothetical protein
MCCPLGENSSLREPQTIWFHVPKFQNADFKIATLNSGLMAIQSYGMLNVKMTFFFY